ncbi:uncharacterized protein with HEPN domain [Longimicrobium terrae]|uniref:Uncharacterized protein with HEPN domain n=2 Tax=Longimicrobium terrae TaxID=1639882 RepID=A0A841H4E4_9BACT|nr:uncharacterized protein with HEPN domain [Longimicrobium terrae]
MLLTAEGVVMRTSGLTEEQLAADEYDQWAVSKALELIGEGAWKLSKPFKAAHPEVPWDRLGAMRHLLVHDYAKVNWRIVYDTLKLRVPELIVALRPLVPPLPGDAES